VEAVEERVDLLGVEALVNGVLMGGILKKKAQCGRRYLVRLRMRVINLSMPGSLLVDSITIAINITTNYISYPCT
jgi:uncharacterized protein with ACT and thioredoxin-like domain